MRHLIAILLALASLPALAAEPTACGALATGIRADNGQPWTGADPLLRVGASGVWELCPEKPPAAAPCAPSSGPSEPREWVDQGRTCRALQADHTLRPGELAAWSVSDGPMRGELVEECPAAGGQRIRWTASCQPVRACLGGPWSFDLGGPSPVYSMTPAHVPVGGRVTARNPAGATIYAECTPEGRMQPAERCLPPVVASAVDVGGWVRVAGKRRQCVRGGVLR